MQIHIDKNGEVDIFSIPIRGQELRALAKEAVRTRDEVRELRSVKLRVKPNGNGKK